MIAGIADTDSTFVVVVGGRKHALRPTGLGAFSTHQLPAIPAVQRRLVQALAVALAHVADAAFHWLDPHGGGLIPTGSECPFFRPVKPHGNISRPRALRICIEAPHKGLDQRHDCLPGAVLALSNVVVEVLTGDRSNGAKVRATA